MPTQPTKESCVLKLLRQRARVSVTLSALLLGCNSCLRAQSSVTANRDQERAAHDAALAEVLRVQGAFVARLTSLGLQCPLPVPRVIVEDVPSFGQYNDEANTLRTSDWSVLKPEERAFAYRIAGPSADEATARATFNEVTHHWIFVHEMGHWWQACRKENAAWKPYAIEYDADRIAAAYWNEAEPALTIKIMRLAQAVLDHTPSPLPAGQPVDVYFNTHYQTLGPSPAYPWFQARMIVDSEREIPKPSFKEALLSR